MPAEITDDYGERTRIRGHPHRLPHPVDPALRCRGLILVKRSVRAEAGTQGWASSSPYYC